MFETPPATFVTLTINLFGRISVVNDLFFWVRRSKTFFDGVRLRKMCILCVPPWCNHHICYIYSDFFFITMQMRDNSFLSLNLGLKRHDRITTSVSSFSLFFLKLDRGVSDIQALNSIYRIKNKTVFVLHVTVVLDRRYQI